MIAYLFHVSILLAGCYAFYWLLLRQETFFRLNRAILLASIGLSLVLPLIPIPANWSLQLFSTEKIADILPSTLEETPLEVKEIEGQPENEVVIDAEATNKPIIIDNNEKNIKESTTPLSILRILTYLYLAGVFVFALAFIIQLVLIIAKRSSLHSIQDGKYQIIELVKSEAPFSFWRSIFINPASYDPDTYEQIIAHEKIHIDQVHFLDKLLAEFLLIMLWFNPFVWLFRKVISNNLEYLTDQSMLTQGFPKQDYQLSLFKVSAPQFPLNLTTNYNQSFLKNRIAMMNTKKSSARSIWKYLFLLPLLGFSMMSLNTIETDDSQAMSIEVDFPASSTTESAQQNPISSPAERITPPKKTIIKPKKDYSNKLTKSSTSTINYGLWKGALEGSEVCFFMEYNGGNNVKTQPLCYNKKKLNGFKAKENQEFFIVQEQGTLFMEGSFANGKGQGIFKFHPDPSFVKFLKEEKQLEIEDRNLPLLFFHNIDRRYIKQAIHSTTDKNIQRHAISINNDYIFSVVNKAYHQSVKEDRSIKFSTTTTSRSTTTHHSDSHSDGHVNIETINGNTYIQGAGEHNINGKIINIRGNETWVITRDGDSYILEEDAPRRQTSSAQKKTRTNKSNSIRPSNDGLEKHYLKQSRGKGHLDWIGYENTVLEPSTQRLYQLPAFCQELQRELVRDEIINAGDKFLFYFGAHGAYVNGWHLSGGHDRKYRNLAAKYDISISKGWNIEIDGQNVLVIGSVKEVEQLRTDLKRALNKDRLISNREDKILVKIEGNRFVVNGKTIPKEKMANYFQLLRSHRITPAPGKIIQMGRKKNKSFIHVGYSEGENSFMGTFSTD